MKRFSRVSGVVLCGVFALAAACQGGADPAEAPHANAHQAPHEPTAEELALRVQVRELIQENRIKPMVAPNKDPKKVAIGKMLFSDSILSGTKDTACVTCHRPLQATVDGVSVPAGATARINPETGARTPGPEQEFMPRNVPDMFNRGQPELTSMFWDKALQPIIWHGEQGFAISDRLEGISEENFLRVLGGKYFRDTMGLRIDPDDLLSAQNMMPVLNRDELRGINGYKDVCGEFNELAAISDADLESVWVLAMKRLLEIEGYRELFAEAYPDTPPEELTFVHASNGLSAFIQDAYTLRDAPWDRFVEGDDSALTEQQLRGVALFYGKGKCGACHSGTLFTDQDVHNIGVTPLGAGPSSRLHPNRKVDRGIAHRSITDERDNYKFRTPPIRNVELTGPYMHNGVYSSLKDVIRHKNNARHALRNYDPTKVRPEFQHEVHKSPKVLDAVEETLSPILNTPLGLTEQEMDDLVAFMEALTSPSAHDLRHTIPDVVPSGLPVHVPKNSNVPSEDGYDLQLDYSQYCADRKAAQAAAQLAAKKPGMPNTRR